MTTADWVGVAVTVIIGLVGVLVPLYLQSRGLEARLTAKIATAIGESETRMRAENREAHAAIGTNIERARIDLASDISKVHTRVDAIDERARRSALAVLGN